MDFATFASKIIEALAWPVTLLILVFKFSDRFRELLGKLTELSLPGGFTGKFSPAIAVAEELAESIDLPDEGLPNAPRANPYELNANPTGVIMESWIALTKLAEEILGGVSHDRTSFRVGRVPDPFKDLGNVGFLPNEELQLLRELKSIRNKAAHSTVDRPTPEDASRFLSLIDKLETSWIARFLAGFPRATDEGLGTNL